MSPFAIFAIVLTIAYIIYYGVTISRDLYGKKGQENESEEVFDVSKMSEIEKPTPVTEDGDSFIIGTQADLEKSSEANLHGGQRCEGMKIDDPYNREAPEKNKAYTMSGAAENGKAAEKSEAEKQVENIKQNMLEGDIQSEVVMNEKKIEDYLVNQQVILFDNQRQSKRLREVKVSDDHSSEFPSEGTNTGNQTDRKSGNNELETRDAI